MDNSFHRRQVPESGTQQKRGFSATSLQIFTSLLPLMQHSINWLASLTRLTEEEQEEAGVYLYRLGDE